MRRFLVILAGCGGIGAGAVAWFASRYEPVLEPGARVVDLSVGGLTAPEAERRLEAWWRGLSDRPIAFTHRALSRQPEPRTLEDWGVRLDVRATLDRVPRLDFWGRVGHRLGLASYPSRLYEPQITIDERVLEQLDEFIGEHGPPWQPARAWMENGKIVRVPERPGLALDRGAFAEQLARAFELDSPASLPLREAERRVSDRDLSRIRMEIASFSTAFQASQVNRNSNIRTAARRINGVILMPGEEFSFNEIVGKRTPKNGFRLAGVFVNGRRDEDFGGGICQVSTTLYNAVLLADLPVVQRQNHSLPVPYVPLGRDATVNWGSIDFRFRNSFDFPIAISAEYAPGRIRFRILGERRSGETVRIVSRVLRSWTHPEKVIEDPTLPPGQTKVIDKGGGGYRVESFRVVLRDGKEIRRERLGISQYRGGPRIVARSPHPAPRPVAREDRPEPRPVYPESVPPIQPAASPDPLATSSG